MSFHVRLCLFMYFNGISMSVYVFSCLWLPAYDLSYLFLYVHVFSCLFMSIHVCLFLLICFLLAFVSCLFMPSHVFCCLLMSVHVCLDLSVNLFPYIFLYADTCLCFCMFVPVCYFLSLSILKILGKLNWRGLNSTHNFCYIILWQIVTGYMQQILSSGFVYEISKNCILPNKLSFSYECARKN